MRVGFPWISLDSLVRIKTFQWVTRLEARKVLPHAFARGERRPERKPTVEVTWKSRIVHGASLP
jgi:hypothetical protein